MSIVLSPGTVCVAKGRLIEIDGADSLTHVCARDMATGEMVRVAVTHIEAAPTRPVALDLGAIPELEWKRSVALAKELDSLAKTEHCTGHDLEQVARRYGIGKRQLQRIRAKYINNPRTTTLARISAGPPVGLNRLDPRVDALIRHAIAKHYMRREKPPKEYVVLRAQAMARRLGLATPSRKAVLIRLNREIGRATDLAREGGIAARRMWQARPGGLFASRPLDLVQIDHTPADVMILSDDRLTVRGRPWVTVAIDVATRCVVGMYIAMHAPSAVSVSLCIEHLALPKPDTSNEEGIWPMYGKPKTILVDNGKDFRSMALTRGCEEHQIELRWRPVRTPEYGGHIERLIGTLMKIAHLLPGTTFSNIKERGNYDSEGKARLTLSEFQSWMAQKVCRFYHQRKHRALGMPPIIAWERAFTDSAGNYVSPPLIAKPLEFRIDFLPFEIRRVRRTGIELNSSRYWHEDLSSMLRSDTPVRVKYDPRDPSEVWVRRDDGLLITVPLIGGRATGTSCVLHRLDAATQARLDAETDRGLELTDSIEEGAQVSTLRARGRARPKKTKEAGDQGHPEPLSTIHHAPYKKPPSAKIEEWT
ncbi:transposase [Stenotrophomonas sp. CFBP 13724]|uniref:Mu transposase C-terminal domain-containing protein n=1 Tax=Stenotrophomonas sp. CFBP 13724 TaxID=2775298 RepID=UPI00177D09A9|nr:Mu transposase C-terminal domain-containing protein [Stenotrophomonas sp. CFBP 13724]MBD8643112.1 transposase [Stenotrophomonas sp. CFBP 13724]